MSHRRLVPITLAIAVLLTACTDGTGSSPTLAPTPPVISSTVAPTTTTTAGAAQTTSVPPTTTTPPTTSAPVADGSLVGVPQFDPADCAFGAPPIEGDYELTFVWSGFLLATSATGGVRCVAPFETQDRIVWGPHADRLLVGTTRITETEAFSGIVAEGATFTRPTGRNLVWVDGGRLWKAALDGSNVRDISFLPEHVSVAYHPAGIEIATAGIDADGLHGVWIARNDGTASQRVVTAAEATIQEVTFSGLSGFLLSFIAEHEDGISHLHELALIGADGLAAHTEFDASIALETERPLTGLVANTWTDEVAVTEGTCADAGGPRARLTWGGELPPLLSTMPSEAIGWLPGGGLVVAAYPDGCDGRRDLWTVGSQSGPAEEPVLIVRDIGAVAVRAVHADPPPPLGEIDLEDFA